MLVLGRRIGESVTIAENIEVTVLDVRGDMVRIGINAPRSVAVHRTELLAALESSNKESASPSEEAVQQLAQQIKDRDA